jgi:transcriptional regulator with XRE-family HTH domain
MSTFGKLLRELRKAKGWTRYRLAKESGLTQEGLRRLEKRNADPKLSTLLKLASALEVGVQDLAGRVPEKSTLHPAKGGRKPKGSLS